MALSAHLISKIEVKIANIAEDVENAIRALFDHGLESELKVSLTKRPYRGNRKAYVLLGEARAVKLLKATHIKIGWVSCRVRRKMEVNRVTAVLGLPTWRWTAGRLTQARVAGRAAKRSTLQGTTQGNRSDIFTPLENISPGTTISRGRCVAHLCRRQPRKKGFDTAYEVKRKKIFHYFHYKYTFFKSFPAT